MNESRENIKKDTESNETSVWKPRKLKLTKRQKEIRKYRKTIEQNEYDEHNW
jgi:hypothetical protein